jgi:hypothetical protein
MLEYPRMNLGVGVSNKLPRWDLLFTLFAVGFGALVRFAPTLLAGFPINDGGMFYAMIEDLKSNRLLLPATSSYNYLNIPFAYPPLSLYAGAILSATGIPTGEIIRWLPPLVSTLSIMAFFWMASQMTGSGKIASISAVAYALMPRSYSWYVMGGGLSRSFGILFLLLTCGSAWILFERPSWERMAVTALFGTGAILSHPETAVHTVTTCILIWFFRGRTARGLRDAVLVALGVVMLTSPWWGSVILQDGIGPFSSAMLTGDHNGLFWLPILTFNFAQEPFAPILTFLGMIGLLVRIIRREWFLPAWLMLPFVLEPRSATAIAAIPLAILAGYGLADFVIPKIASLSSHGISDAADWTMYMQDIKAVRIAIGYVLFFVFLGAFAYDLSLATYVIPAPSRAAMQWVGANTPAHGRFLVLTGRTDPFSDGSAEWFPVLAHRTSVNTIQGQEWILGREFMPFFNDLSVLESCLNAGASCLTDWAAAHGVQYDYVYLEKPLEQNAAGPSGLLLHELRQDAAFTLVYENDGAAIFQRK